MKCNKQDAKATECSKSGILSVDSNFPLDPTTREYSCRGEKEYTIEQTGEDVEGGQGVEKRRARSGGGLGK